MSIAARTGFVQRVNNVSTYVSPTNTAYLHGHTHVYRIAIVILVLSNSLLPSAACCVSCLHTQGSLRAATLLAAGWTTRLTYLTCSRTINGV